MATHTQPDPLAFLGDELADLRARYGGAADASEGPNGTRRSSFSDPNPVTSGDNGDNPHK